MGITKQTNRVYRRWYPLLIGAAAMVSKEEGMPAPIRSNAVAQGELDKRRWGRRRQARLALTALMAISIPWVGPTTAKAAGAVPPPSPQVCVPTPGCSLSDAALEAAFQAMAPAATASTDAGAATGEVGGVAQTGPATKVGFLNVSTGQSCYWTGSFGAQYQKPPLAVTISETGSITGTDNCPSGAVTIYVSASIYDFGLQGVSTTHSTGASGSGAYSAYAYPNQEVGYYTFPFDYHFIGSALEYAFHWQAVWQNGWYPVGFTAWCAEVQGNYGFGLAVTQSQPC